MKIVDSLESCVDQFIKNKEQLERLNGAGIQVVVAVLAVVEMESAEFLELDQPRDDHFYINVRRVMPQIHKTRCLWTKLTSAVIADSPIVDHCGIKRWFEELVFQKERPVIRY